LSARLHLTSNSPDPFASLGSWSLWGTREQFVELESAGERRSICLKGALNSGWLADIGESQIAFSLFSSGENDYRYATHECDVSLSAAVQGPTITLFMEQGVFIFTVPDPLAVRRESGSVNGGLVSPMPGLVRLVPMKVGSRVSKGDTLVVMEAMKMEQTISAPFDGRIAALHVAEGDRIAEGTVLVTLSAGAGDGSG
jgi:3-methylcrotonyl-CoA carboxylase alpha subunit